MKIIFLVLSSFLIGNGFAQTNYFQQEVNYAIDVRLDDVKHELFASEKIEYVNNSSQTLREIYFHLWPNAYKNDNTALAQQLLEDGDTAFYYSNDTERGFIDQLNFKVNDVAVKWTYDSVHIDICKIQLNQPLLPREKIMISTPFHVKIPNSRFSRLGHEGQAYQITQWYPKPAVFDRNGWNVISYLNQGEFYSEFGSFDVKITLPKNYVAGATGDLVDGEKETAWLNEKVQETKKRTSYGRDLSFPPSHPETKTLHFHQDRVHDFAWFADKRYHVMKGAVTLPHSKKTVTTWTMYTNSKPHLWVNSINYVNSAIHYYSLWNGDYPYNSVTAVEGALSAGGGMEYPNITVIGPVHSPLELELVIVHEVGHNWFYGILGSNERIHPWMDEGMNSFNETRYMETKYAGSDKNILSGLMGNLDAFLRLNLLSHNQIHELSYLVNARRGLDQPIELPASEYTKLNYGGIVYSKTAIALNYLKAYLGDSLFDKCMQSYFNEWKFKHPQPADFQKMMEDVSGKKLAWFFDDLIKTTKKLDYKICKTSAIKDLNDSITTINILIRNKENINGPFSITGIKNGVAVSTQWKEGFSGKKQVAFPAGQYDSFQVDHYNNMPEISRQNNFIRTKGFLKKTEPLQFKLLGSIETPKKTQIFYTPVIGWNQYNKLMPGIAIYNSLVPSKPFEYVLVPMLGLGSRSMVGSGKINYNWYPSGSPFQNIQMGFSAARYGFKDPLLHYERLMPYLLLTLKKKKERDPVNQRFTIRSISIRREKSLYDLITRTYKESLAVINNITYELENKQIPDPYKLTIDLQQGKKFVKTSIESNYRISYKGRNRGFDVRLFAGAFLYHNTRIENYNFRMNGWSGEQDYLTDEVFLGRTERNGMLSQQMIIREGGFKVPTSIGQSGKWLAAVNLKTSIPGRLPIRFFVDLGTYSGAGAGTTKGFGTFMYDAGFELSIIPDVFNIYFPIFMSDDITREHAINGITFPQTIRFELNISRLNPFTFIRNITF